MTATLKWHACVLQIEGPATNRLGYSLEDSISVLPKPKYTSNNSGFERPKTGLVGGFKGSFLRVTHNLSSDSC